MKNFLVSLLWVLDLAPEAVMWNPWNKVVQCHRDGTIYHWATNVARKRRGLSVPWSPEIGTKEKAIF